MGAQLRKTQDSRLNIYKVNKSKFEKFENWTMLA